MSDPAPTPRRRRKTRRSVLVTEAVARTVIAAGGFGTILAVLVMTGFLLVVVWPLFTSAEVVERGTYTIPGDDAAPTHVGVGEHLLFGWALFDDGTVATFRLDDGTPLARRPLDAEATPTAVDVDREHLALGFADGRVALGTLAVRAELLADDAVPEEFVAMDVGAVVPWDDEVFVRTPQGQWRRHGLVVELDDPVDTGSASPVRHLDHVPGERRSVVLTSHDDGAIVVTSLRRRRNLLTGATTTTATHTSVALPADAPTPIPDHLLVRGNGAEVLAAWSDGTLFRLGLDAGEVRLEEVVDLCRDGAGPLRELEYLLGGTTLVSGHADGTVRGWFATRSSPESAPAMSLGHVLSGTSGVTALAFSSRNRSFAVGREDGSIDLFHMTAEERLGRATLRQGVPVRRLGFSPRSDALIAVDEARLGAWTVDSAHPEISAGVLLAPIWYEGDPAPSYVWQSSGGDAFEPKISLVPLIFGTLKATLYAMLFSVPIAVFAALGTSEFLPRRARARVKQTIEMMASLPSVVLGFLAALVVAPFVEQVVPAVLACFLTVPIVWLAGAHAWQFLPRGRGTGWSRFAAVALLLPIGILAGAWLGPFLADVLFGGDLLRWLDGGGEAGAFGGWLLVLFPIVALLSWVFAGRSLLPALRAKTAAWPETRAAACDLLVFVGGLAACVLASAALAWGFTSAGHDVRGGIVDTYVQRNALIVGFAMGFAVVPIIYTLVEDALSAVPESLRAASLAAGATPWQTAIRVVVPTAMSGIFSAVMVGLGRAVGETMIVLMAAGNTPVMEWNIFNGFRTLSATLAVELPEAVQGSTLYRVLFLSALTLFAMTIVVNTIAEFVRMRFRKRAGEL